MLFSSTISPRLYDFILLSSETAGVMGSAVFAAVSGLLTPVRLAVLYLFLHLRNKTAASDKQKNDRKNQQCCKLFHVTTPGLLLVLNI